ncbi:hypothetical protein Tco_1360400 [Tanacetum coccineum]
MSWVSCSCTTASSVTLVLTPVKGHWCYLLSSLSWVYPSISDPIADCLGSLSSGFGIQSADKPIIYPTTSSGPRDSSRTLLYLILACGVVEDGRGGSGGDGSGNDASTGGVNGDEALNLPMAALKPRGARIWFGLPYGGWVINEMSGDGGGVGTGAHQPQVPLYPLLKEQGQQQVHLKGRPELACSSRVFSGASSGSSLRVPPPDPPPDPILRIRVRQAIIPLETSNIGSQIDLVMWKYSGACGFLWGLVCNPVLRWGNGEWNQSLFVYDEPGGSSIGQLLLAGQKMPSLAQNQY